LNSTQNNLFNVQDKILAAIELFPDECTLDAVIPHSFVFTTRWPPETVPQGSKLLVTLFIDNSVLCRLALTLSSISPTKAGLTQIIMRADGSEDTEIFWSALLFARKDDTLLSQDYIPRMPNPSRLTEEARTARLQILQDHTGVPLNHVIKTDLRARDMRRTVESFIGAVEIPLGIAGPLLFSGQHVEGVKFAPMATTEGSLVASCTRGALAITESGGVRTAVLGKRLSRVPLFQMESVKEALFLANWIEFNYERIRNEATSMSQHAELQGIESEVLGRDVHVHFVYDTGDSAGQNMTTGCTWHACQWILRELKRSFNLSVRSFLIESNLSSDKKVTHNSFVKGRGTRVVAECNVNAEALERLLHVTPAQLVQAYRSLAQGAVAGGMIGMNVNVPNVIAAIFVATGQDIASVHESGMGQLTIELNKDGSGVYASLLLPSLLIGTVGGGTSLPGQRECLEIMDSAGSGRSRHLAEIICGFALALDLSTLSALAVDEFASAHHHLGKPYVAAGMVEAAGLKC
jgi:hydroxymethylglutaryl-CoA reductase (NADPH)